MRKIVFSALASIGLYGAAEANDGFFGLPAGGLTLQQSANIAMQEEDLYISLDEVRVNYVFRNDSNAPVKAQVGFPMPGLPVSVNFDAETGYDLHEIKDLELLKFETRINGQVVTSKPIVRAYYYPEQIPWEKQDRFYFTDAKDITSELVAASVPLTFDANAIRAAFARLSPAKKAEWNRRAIYFKDANYEAPNWFLSTVFVRDQTFPATTLVRVQHKYKPFPSGFVMVSNHFAFDKELAKSSCVDAPTERAIKRLLKPQGGGAGHVIDYILTTANTWKGPIGRFRLTVNKGAARNIVSFCGTGVKKTGPTSFSLEYTNFKPTQDLKVLIVKGAEL